MDLNELLFHHQIAVMNAKQARSTEDRTTYFSLVEYYSKRIQQLRDKSGIPRHRWD